MSEIRYSFFDNAAQRMPDGMRPSPFTKREEWIGQSDLAFAMVNYFPSTKGHAMILPRDFAVYRFYELAHDEILEHHRFAKLLRHEFNKHFQPDGYNLGWNVEFHGGQSIAHAHMHVMPRYAETNIQHEINPRGGVARMPFPHIPAFWDGQARAGEDATLVSYLMNEAPVVAENEHALAVQLPDTIAMTAGHSWIFLKKKRPDFFSADEQQIQAQLDLALTVMNVQTQNQSPPDGFNLGWDVGAAAGQITDQCYLQLVPRYRGDMDSPRGGIVRIIPEAAWPDKTDYYDKKNVGKDVAIERAYEFPFTFFTDDQRNNVIDARAELALR